MPWASEKYLQTDQHESGPRESASSESNESIRFSAYSQSKDVSVFIVGEKGLGEWFYK